MFSRDEESTFIPPYSLRCSALSHLHCCFRCLLSDFCRVASFVRYSLFCVELSRRPWTKYDDNAVRQLVAEHGTRNWAVVEQHMVSVYGIVGRSGKQSRERWHNHLSEWAPADRRAIPTYVACVQASIGEISPCWLLVVL